MIPSNCRLLSCPDVITSCGILSDSGYVAVGSSMAYNWHSHQTLVPQDSPTRLAVCYSAITARLHAYLLQHVWNSLPSYLRQDIRETCTLLTGDY